jgi:small subunit ribosomal protein S17
MMTEEVSQKETAIRTTKRKVRSGMVSSDKMDKTITVIVRGRKSHPLYEKTVSFSKKLRAHDEKNEAREGDVVEIMETRPLSKLKRWRLTRILKKKI